MVGLYIDLDMPRSGDSLYERATEQVISLDDILNTFTAIGLRPTAVNGTGNGSHVHLLLKQPFNITTKGERERVTKVFKGVSRYVKDELAAKGWKTDITADLARMDRVVGSYNVKDSSNPKVVIAEFLNDDQRYELDYLASFAPSEEAEISAVGAPHFAYQAEAGERNLGDFDAVLVGCAFSRHCVANPAEVSEPEWRAFLSTLAYCKNGRELAHKYSSGHPNYSPEETDRMFDRVSSEAGPHTYNHIRSIATSFQPDDSFALYGTVVAPISFAHYEPELVGLMVNYAYDLATERFINLRTMAAKTEKSFKAEHVHRAGLKSPHEAFYRAKIALRVQKRAYLPGQPLIVGGPDDRVLNVYRPPSMLPVEGEHDLILQHFEVVIPDEAVRENVLDRLAFALQYPATKMESAIVLYGPPGGGKSTIVKWIGELIGPWNMRSLPTTAIESKYGAAKGNIYLGVFDEIRGVTKDGVNNLKALETEPTVWVEEKHMPLHEVTTPKMIIMMSNFPNALPLEPNDRRHLVINTPSKISEKEYFEKLYAAAPDQLPGFAYFLHQRDVTGFNPHQTPISTRGRAEMVKAAMPDMQRAVMDALEGEVGIFSKDFGQTEDVAKALIEDGWPSYAPPNAKLLGVVLTELGFEQLPRRTLSDGTKPRLRAWRSKDEWMAASRDEIEAHMSSKSSPPVIDETSRPALDLI